jgi:hypothetical protein
VSWLVLVPAGAAAAIRSGGRYGYLTCRIAHGQELAAVSKVSSETGPLMPTDLPARHWLTGADEVTNARWYRVAPELHGIWFQLRARAGAALALDAFAQHIPTMFTKTGQVAVTYAPDTQQAFGDVGVPDLLGWLVDPGGAVTPMSLEVEPAVTGIATLKPAWPVQALADTSVMVVGAGSIGGAAAIDLATYGVGHLDLVDPDRLLWHNLIRHVGSARDIGRPKVCALADQLREIRPDTSVEAHEIDVVADADVVRGMLPGADVILCAADGVAPRRVVSHLARRAHRDAVLACVLEDGALGEVLRLRPFANSGCLLCQRAHLTIAGGIDPEPALDAPYGHGTRHRAMTAVGADLHLVGNLAAKVTVATVLERRGHGDQALPGEQAVIGLRPTPGLAAPFDLTGAGEIRWAGSWPARPNCPTCSAP